MELEPTPDSHEHVVSEAHGRPAPTHWEDASDEVLLKRRICDLGLRISGSPLEQRIERLHEDLAAKGIRYRPPCYLATEWLCPDKVPAIGIAFCLVHPRLVRLEKTMMLEAEGETEEACMKLLRHEAGHTFNYAYRLHNRTRWRRLFGPMSAPYDPHGYFMRPYSRQFVLHLEDNYAQAHPDEDFAETFAVWLTPGLDWRARYAGWGALKKLEYVDHLMKDIGSKPALVTGGTRAWAASHAKSTLENYYKQKRREFAKTYPGFYDPVLRRLFTEQPHTGQDTAARFLSRHRHKLTDTISRWARIPKYVADSLIRRLSQRSKELGLHLRGEDKDILLTTGVCLTTLVLEARERIARDMARRDRP